MNAVEMLVLERERELQRASYLHDRFSEACRVWATDRFNHDYVLALRAADKEFSNCKDRIIRLQNQIRAAGARIVLDSMKGKTNGNLRASGNESAG